LKKDNTGRFFIDRDGKYFNHILNYLRDGTTPPFSPKYKPEKYHCLASEAQFYQIQGLIDKLQQKYPKWKLTGMLIFIMIVLLATSFNVIWQLIQFGSDPIFRYFQSNLFMNITKHPKKLL
jgi:hypothetical protein